MLADTKLTSQTSPSQPYGRIAGTISSSGHGSVEVVRPDVAYPRDVGLSKEYRGMHQRAEHSGRAR